MLVLTRKAGEEILIDGHIQVKVIQCANGRTRLGITAPRDVQISRPESTHTASGNVPNSSSGCNVKPCQAVDQPVRHTLASHSHHSSPTR